MCVHRRVIFTCGHYVWQDLLLPCPTERAFDRGERFEACDIMWAHPYSTVKVETSCRRCVAQQTEDKTKTKTIIEYLKNKIKEVKPPSPQSPPPDDDADWSAEDDESWLPPKPSEPAADEEELFHERKGARAVGGDEQQGRLPDDDADWSADVDESLAGPETTTVKDEGGHHREEDDGSSTELSSRGAAGILTPTSEENYRTGEMASASPAKAPRTPLGSLSSSPPGLQETDLGAPPKSRRSLLPTPVKRR